MFKRMSALIIALVLSVPVGGTAAFAKAVSGDEPKSAENTSTPNTTNELKNEKLRMAIDKLVSEAKAGKVAPEPRPQMQPKQSNNLSKGTKIAIGVGIAVAIVVIIVAAKSDKDPGPIGTF